jgi:signal transduction histidine kinase
MVTGTIQEVRSISYGLRPFQLDILGLTQSVKSLVDDVADASEIHFVQKIENIDGLFTQKDEINIFRIVQECLNNIIKHSKAVEAKVEINKLNNHIDILIEDNGVGLPESNGGSGMGLIGIKERVNILGGKLNITNKFPQGTVVKISIGLVHKAIKPEV